MAAKAAEPSGCRHDPMRGYRGIIEAAHDGADGAMRARPASHCGDVTIRRNAAAWNRPYDRLDACREGGTQKKRLRPCGRSKATPVSRDHVAAMSSGEAEVPTLPAWNEPPNKMTGTRRS